MDQIVNSKIIVVNLVPCYGGISKNNFNVLLNNLNFEPDSFRIEEFVFSINNPNDNMYCLSCSQLADNAPLISYTGRTTFPINMSLSGSLKVTPINLAFNLNIVRPDPRDLSGGVINPGLNSGVGYLTNDLDAIQYPQNGGANATNAYLSLTINFFKIGKK